MSGKKDRIEGKVKQIEGKLTDDKVRVAQGTVQRAKGDIEGAVTRFGRSVKSTARRVGAELRGGRRSRGR